MENNVYVIEREASDWEEAILITSCLLYKNGCVKENFAEKCIEREKVFPTGLPSKVPVAIPHTDGSYVIKPAVCMLRLTNPVLFKNMEDPEKEIAVDYVFNIAIKSSEDQLKMLSVISNIFQDDEFLNLPKDTPIEVLKEKFLNKWRE